MISFRYHLVSIIAVFLALALGIVVGTTGLNGAILSDLRKNVRELKSENSDLRTSNSTYQSQAKNANEFAGDYSSKILAGSLTGQKIVVISAPGASSDVKKGVEAAVTAGGGTVVGRIQLLAGYIDPTNSAAISSFVTSGVQPTGLNLPQTSDSATLAGALLGYVLAGKGTPTDILSVIAGMAKLNLLTVENKNYPAAAQLAVVITGGTLATTDPKAKAMPALVSQFTQYGLKTVVAGDATSATEAGLVATVRGDSTMQRSVSTVDNADTALGQLSTALALAGLERDTVGQYGIGPGANNLFPAPSK